MAADANAGPGLDSERGLSSVAAAYRRAEPYAAASSTLMASVAGFTALGYGLDRWLDLGGPWMLIAGSLLGIATGFVGFFSRILRADAAAKRQRASAGACAAGACAEGPVAPPGAARGGSAARGAALSWSYVPPRKGGVGAGGEGRARPRPALVQRTRERSSRGRGVRPAGG